MMYDYQSLERKVLDDIDYLRYVASVKIRNDEFEDVPVVLASIKKKEDFLIQNFLSYTGSLQIIKRVYELMKVPH